MRADKINRLQSPQLDMNPMVDMAFLLVTFFLLATTFKVPEPASVVLPRAVVSERLPADDLITITVSKDGRAFISISDASKKLPWLLSFLQLYGLTLQEQQKVAFTKLSGVGVAAEELADWLNMATSERNRAIQSGVPMDSTRNQLADWLVLARAAMPQARVAIKSDRETPYKYIQQVVNTLTANQVLRFNLLTETRRLDD